MAMGQNEPMLQTVIWAVKSVQLTAVLLFELSFILFFVQADGVSLTNNKSNYVFMFVLPIVTIKSMLIVATE